ncbi:MAG: mechanosensitive ion channel family protein [Candidatus Cloacimonetes bacterium]|nr:mechanosensitive ion channel family protein [Candidatus Cloacimonadota bacterium]
MDIMNNLQIYNWITPERITLLVRFLLILVIGFPLIKLLNKIIMKFLGKYLNPQSEMVAERFIWYTLLVILVVSALNQLGFKLSALLGAAGIFGVAIGFASQTSFSNLISGMFMISEKSFSVGDIIKIGGTTGIVLSIDLLSVKLRTFDNQYIRIPNENLIKSELTNISKFPIRRTDFEIRVAYHSNLRHVEKVIKEVINDNHLALKEPYPLVTIVNFGDSSINFKIGVWATKENFIDCSNSLKMDLFERFQAENIEIPFPQRVLSISDNDHNIIQQALTIKNSLKEKSSID